MMIGILSRGLVQLGEPPINLALNSAEHLRGAHWPQPSRTACWYADCP